MPRREYPDFGDMPFRKSYNSERDAYKCKCAFCHDKSVGTWFDEALCEKHKKMWNICNFCDWYLDDCDCSDREDEKPETKPLRFQQMPYRKSYNPVKDKYLSKCAYCHDKSIGIWREHPLCEKHKTMWGLCSHCDSCITDCECNNKQ